MKTIHKLVVFLCGVLLVTLGFFRDFFFKTLNVRLSYLWYKDEIYYQKAGEQLFGSMDYYTLYYSKFGFTIVCSLIYMLLTIIITYVIFKKTKFIKYILLAYIFIIVASAIIFLSGYIVELFYDPSELKYLKQITKSPLQRLYLLSRYIMGFVQSPILSAILILSLFLYKTPGMKDLPS